MRVRRARASRRSRRRWRGRRETGEEGRERGASIPAESIIIKTMGEMIIKEKETINLWGWIHIFRCDSIS